MHKFLAGIEPRYGGPRHVSASDRARVILPELFRGRRQYAIYPMVYKVIAM